MPMIQMTKIELLIQDVDEKIAIERYAKLLHSGVRLGTLTNTFIGSEPDVVREIRYMVSSDEKVYSIGFTTEFHSEIDVNGVVYLLTLGASWWSTIYRIMEVVREKEPPFDLEEFITEMNEFVSDYSMENQ